MISAAFILWCQQGGGNKGGNAGIRDILGPIIFIIIFIVLRTLGTLMKNKASQEKRQQDTEPADEVEMLLKLVKDSRKKERTVKAYSRKRRKKQPQLSAEEPDIKRKISEESRPVRTVLAKELAPQGIGHRFEAEPGTLDSASIVVPSVEPTVKPALESLTGIYDEQPGSETSSTAAFAGLYAMLAQPEGIRNAVVLSEIFAPRGISQGSKN